MSESRSMYVLFSRQNTKIGRVIRVFLPSSRYTHVALSLDGELNTVYSFSRARHDSPFSGGFMREYPVHYILGDMDVPVKICKVELSDEEYAKAKTRLEDSICRREQLIYNLFDAAALPFGKRYKIKDAYTCVSFTSYVVGMDDTRDIADLESRISANTVYVGSLKELIKRYNLGVPADDDYFVRRGLYAAAQDFASLFTRLMRRRGLRVGMI